MSVADGVRERRDGGGAVSHEPGRPGRREVLAASGAAALAVLAGCGGRLLDDSHPTIAREDLAAATDGEAPTVPETLPVDIEASFVDTQREIARSKLDGTPAPFDEDEIPNGVIRERLNNAYDGVLRSIRDASGAPTPYERLEHAAGARDDAHEVWAAWAAIDGDLTVTDLRESIPAVNDDVDTFASTHAHVGDDPVRAAVVHAEIERRIGGARRWLSVPDREFDVAAETALDLAGVAVDIERARVDAETGLYLFERFRGSLDDPENQRDRLTDAGTELGRRIDDRADSVPTDGVDDPTTLVDREVGTTAGVHALDRLAREARSRVDQSRTGGDDPRLASAVVEAVSTLTYLGAFERLRDRIEGGDDVAVDSVGDVTDLRSAAIEAVAAAGDAERGQALVDVVRPRIARELGLVDGRFGNGPDDVRVESVARDAAGYVRIAEACRTLPTAAETVAEVLRESA